VESVFQDAFAALKARKFADAERLFRIFLAGQPKHIGALNLLTITLMSMERFAEAESYVARAVKLSGNSDASFRNYGIILRNLGKPERALEQFDRALKLNPKAAEAWNSRGTVFNDLGQYERAVADFDKAIALDPGLYDAFYNKGKSLVELFRYDEALAASDKALALKPSLAHAWVARGNILGRLKCFDEAAGAYEKVLALEPAAAEAWLGRGNILTELKRYDEALTSYGKALALKPDMAEAWNGRGHVLYGLTRYSEALSAYERALDLKPDLTGAWNGLGHLYIEQRRYDEAIVAYDKALLRDPDLVEAWNGRANVFFHLRRHGEALAAYDRALTLKPDLAEAWFGRGNVFFDLNRDAEALTCYDKAIAIDPSLADVYFNKSLVQLSLGEYRDGWELYEWRWKIRSFTSPNRNFVQQLWLGNRELAGKTILIHAEQGFGDTINFFRYLSLLNAHNCKIVFEAQKPLVPLFQDQRQRIQVVAAGDDLPKFDVHCPLLSLPLAFKTTLETIPASIPRLRAGEKRIVAWRKRLGPKTRPRIGLFWSGGNPNVEVDARRIPLEKLLPVITDAAEWHALQKELRDCDRESLRRAFSIVDHSRSLNDFADTAALIAEMDLVVSIDAAVAHLAGALGKPVWILLPFHADFRWLRDRDDSPWYPTTKLFRQTNDGEWGDVIRAISEQLKTVLAASR